MIYLEVMIDQAEGVAWIVIRALAALSGAVNGSRILWRLVQWCAQTGAAGCTRLKHRLLAWAGAAIALYALRSLRRLVDSPQAALAFVLLVVFAVAAFTAQQQGKSLSDLLGEPGTPLSS